MNEIKHEFRYYVIKRRDINSDQEVALQDTLHDAEIPCQESVVVESDWPNYEHTWATIQRVSEGTYDDPYAENERLRARVAELAAKAMQVGIDYSQAHVLRKQAEAVEAATNEHEIKSATDDSKCYSVALLDYAKRLRQQADELESQSEEGGAYVWNLKYCE